MFLQYVFIINCILLILSLHCLFCRHFYLFLSSWEHQRSLMELDMFFQWKHMRLNTKSCFDSYWIYNSCNSPHLICCFTAGSILVYTAFSVGVLGKESPQLHGMICLNDSQISIPFALIINYNFYLPSGIHDKQMLTVRNGNVNPVRSCNCLFTLTYLLCGSWQVWPVSTPLEVSHHCQRF